MVRRREYLIGILFVATMLASIGPLFRPEILQLASFTCSKQFDIRMAGPNKIKVFCVDPQTGEGPQISVVLLFAVLTGLFSIMLLIPAGLFLLIRDRLNGVIHL